MMRRGGERKHDCFWFCSQPPTSSSQKTFLHLHAVSYLHVITRNNRHPKVMNRLLCDVSVPFHHLGSVLIVSRFRATPSSCSQITIVMSIKKEKVARVHMLSSAVYCLSDNDRPVAAVATHCETDSGRT